MERSKFIEKAMRMVLEGLEMAVEEIIQTVVCDVMMDDGCDGVDEVNGDWEGVEKEVAEMVMKKLNETDWTVK